MRRFLIRFLLWLLFPRRMEAVRLNLEPHMPVVINPAGVKTASLHPVNAVGAPAPVTSIVWAVDSTNVTIAPAADGMSCVVTGADVGQARLTVSAVTAGGATLTDFADFDVQADLEAVSLGLTVA